MIFLILFLLPLLADTDPWGPALISAIPQIGFSGFVAWYLLTRAGPKAEEMHEKQLLAQRADLLNVAAKERETLERIVAIFSDARFASLKEIQETIVELHQKNDHNWTEMTNKLDRMTEAFTEVKRTLEKDTGLRDELAKTRKELQEFDKRMKRSDNPS